MTPEEEHKILYPEQYTHPLVGKLVETPTGNRFVVRRVVGSAWGKLAIGDDPRKSYGVKNLTIVG